MAGILSTNSWNNAYDDGQYKAYERKVSVAQGAFADAVSKAGSAERAAGTNIVAGKPIREYREQMFDRIGANAPKSVKQAWLDAADAVGTDGLGISNSGKLDHISQLMVRQVEKSWRGESTSNLLGNSVQSAIRVAREMLYELEHPRVPNSVRTAEELQNKENEKKFYREFIRRLEETSSNAQEEMAVWYKGARW